MLFRAALACVFVLVLAVPAVAEEEQPDAVWNLGKQKTGSRLATGIDGFNLSCRGKRDFEIEIVGQARRFLSITGTNVLKKIAMGETKTAPAVLDLTSVPAGVYNDGVIVVTCVNCPKSCKQDKIRLAVHLTVIDPESSESSTAVASSTRERKPPCPEDTSPCDEMKARADAAREAAAAARRAAEQAARDQQYDQQDAQWTDEDIERDLEYARTLRRQAADWRELADNARESTGINRDRANQWPVGHEYRESWEQDVAHDEANARERDERADRLEKEAEKLEAPVERRRQEAEEQRTRADRLQAQAEAMARAAEDAQAAYEACLKRLADECEARRLQTRLDELVRANAAAAASAAASGSTGSAPGDPDTEDPGPGILRGYTSLPPRLSEFCKWATYEIPREAIVTNVRLVSANNNDDTSALEINTRTAPGTTIGFRYHCKKSSGTAVIAFTQSSGNNPKRYKLRIGCIPAD